MKLLTIVFAMFQVTGNMGQQHLIPLQTPSTGAQMYFSGQPTGLINSVTPISSITMQAPPTSRSGGGVSGDGRNVLYSPNISGMGPLILMNQQPPNREVSDQPTDLSKEANNSRNVKIRVTKQ